MSAVVNNVGRKLGAQNIMYTVNKQNGQRAKISACPVAVAGFRDTTSGAIQTNAANKSDNIAPARNAQPSGVCSIDPRTKAQIDERVQSMRP